MTDRTKLLEELETQSSLSEKNRPRPLPPDRGSVAGWDALWALRADVTPNALHLDSLKGPF